MKLSKKLKQSQNSLDETHSDIFISHLTPKQQQKVLSLIGRRCSIQAKLNEKETEILWDTGAQVSIISSHLLERNLPDVCIRDVGDLLNGDLHLTAANGSDIPYCGYVEISLQIGNAEHSLPVSFLVTEQKLELPIIGFNVIEHLIKSNNLKDDDITATFAGISPSNFCELC